MYVFFICKIILYSERHLASQQLVFVVGSRLLVMHKPYFRILLIHTTECGPSKQSKYIIYKDLCSMNVLFLQSMQSFSNK